MAAPATMGSGVKIVLLVMLALPQLHAATYDVIVAGLGGTPEYQTQFDKWASDLEHNLQANGPDTHIQKITGAAATRDNLRHVLTDLAGSLRPDDAFALMMIGHGTFDGTEYKYNIPGPDITAEELAQLLNRLPATRQLVVNMTSCSGASLPVLARKDRIVITATKSGTEKNATVFARYWIDALQDPAADADHNGSVSALEAFEYARRKTAGYFDAEKLLATEHPLLSDNGTATGIRDVKAPGANTFMAAAFPVLRPPTETATAVNPEKQQLLSKKQELEAKIDKLKYQKASMEPDEYKQQLTALLLELARTQADIDR
jgi:hypothetical protein